MELTGAYPWWVDALERQSNFKLPVFGNRDTNASQLYTHRIGRYP